MKLGRLNHIGVATPDLDASIAFYRDVLGLTVGPRPDFDTDGYWLYAGGHAIVRGFNRQVYNRMFMRTLVPKALAKLGLTVNDIDLWVGGLAEKHVAGGNVGETFSRIIADQSTRLRDGDRFWYQNQGFDKATMRDIESTTLSSLILKNTDTQHIQADAFVFYERRSGSSVMENPAAPQLVIGANGGDTLVGGTKADMLVAGTGSQTMTGAAGRDTFVVSSTGVNAVITDFKVGQDKLKFENLGTAKPKVTTENGNAVISVGTSKVILVGVTAAQFRLSDISSA